MPIDQAFLPPTEGLATYVDESPNFTRKQLIVRGYIHDKNFYLDGDGEDELKLGNTKDGLHEKQLHITKLYHAQCLEKYPNHFVAFVKLSNVQSSPDAKNLHNGNTLFCLIITAELYHFH